MSLYQNWRDLAQAERDDKNNQRFWDEYFESEKELYRKLLAEHEMIHKGTFSALASEFGWDETYFAGFLDGINTSLKAELVLESIEPETEITLDIDFEKLLFNMYEAKAPWLYELEEWESVLDADIRKAVFRSWRESKVFVSEKKPGANEPCPCGSGKKYKKCCGRATE